MNEPIETIERGGFVAKIYPDLDAESPASWTQVGTLAYSTRNAGVGDMPPTVDQCDSPFPCDACEGYGTTYDEEDATDERPCPTCNGTGRHGEALARRSYQATHVLPVRAWDDRNGTELRVADDWSEANGWIYATTESVAETIGKDATDEQVRAALESELGEWQKWAQGEVYGVVVEDESGEEVDSCWGFYGDDYAEQEAERMLAEAIESANESAFDRLVAAGCEARPIIPDNEEEADATARGYAVEVTTPSGDTFGPFPDYSTALRHPDLRLATSTDDEREADRRLGADIRAMYEDWMEDAEDGIIPGSASDQCCDLYDVLTRNGLVVR